jgi:hypothetical protein
MTTNQSIILICISGLMFATGIIVGWLYEKRKRDKEMAGICAERLLRKPQISEPPSPQVNAVFQQMNNTYQQLVSQNPNIGIGQQSNFANMIGGGMGSSQGLAQSQFGNNRVLSGILGKL